MVEEEAGDTVGDLREVCDTGHIANSSLTAHVLAVVMRVEDVSMVNEAVEARPGSASFLAAL